MLKQQMYMMLLLFLIKTCNVSQRSRKHFLLNEKFIFNTNPCTKRKESNLSISTMTCIKTTRIITTNVVTQKMNKILKSINSVTNKIK